MTPFIFVSFKNQVYVNEYANGKKLNLALD